MSVFGAPGEGGFQITPLVGPDGQLHGIHFGPSSKELIEQRKAARAAALAADAERKKQNSEARHLWAQTQVARVSEAGDAIKNAAIRAEQAPRKAACMTLPSEVIAEALDERKKQEASPSRSRSASPSRFSRMLGRSPSSDAMAPSSGAMNDDA